MEYTTLGRTGLKVSRMGLGCGGHSRLGVALGKGEESAINVVREALALGVNFIDTAESYGTEEVVGKGINGVPRSNVVISTKAGVTWHDHLCTAAEYMARVEACLARLHTDYIDVFHLHGVSPEEYPHAVNELVPALKTLQQQGKVRFIGITEQFINDPSHRMLAPAVQDDIWDVVMVGFNLLNQSARETVLPTTSEKSIGTLCMFAVRRALSNSAALVDLIADLGNRGLVDPSAFTPGAPLDFLTANGVAESVMDAAYRYCRYETGLDIILSGTSSTDHLLQNAASLERPPLPPAVVENLKSMFKGVDCISGN